MSGAELKPKPDGVTEYRIKLEPELKEYLGHLWENAELALEELKKETRSEYRRERIRWHKLRCREAKQSIDQEGNIMDVVVLEGAAEPANLMKAFIAKELVSLGYGYHNMLMVELEWGED
jgi:hypothetical protein